MAVLNEQEKARREELLAKAQFERLSDDEQEEFRRLEAKLRLNSLPVQRVRRWR